MSSAPSTLPDAFGIGPADTLIYFYANQRSSFKNPVLFTSNMFCLLQHGRKEVLTAAGRETVTSEEVLILTSGSTLMSEHVTDSGRYEAILVFFSNRTLTDFCTRHQVTIEKKPVVRPVLKVRRDCFLDNYCRSLQLLREQHNRTMDELKVQELLGYVSTSYPEAFQELVSRALADKADVRLQQMVALHADKSLTVEELAFLCNMSVSTFKRHFADIYRMSPQKYFTRLKMEQARSLLALRQRSSAIYAALGYESLSAFSNEFKKYYGRSPKQFQNELAAQVTGPSE